MSFTMRKDEDKGVVVLGVDGQLIVGNRHELKQKALEALEAGVHCIELQRDFGNLDEVLRAIEDDDRREAIVEAAWRDIVASGKYTYRGFVAKVVSDALEGQSEKNAPRLTIGQRIAAAWLAVRDPLTWCVVAVGCRVRSALRRIGRRRTA